MERNRLTKTKICNYFRHVCARLQSRLTLVPKKYQDGFFYQMERVLSALDHGEPIPYDEADVADCWPNSRNVTPTLEKLDTMWQLFLFSVVQVLTNTDSVVWSALLGASSEEQCALLYLIQATVEHHPAIRAAKGGKLVDAVVKMKPHVMENYAILEDYATFRRRGKRKRTHLDDFSSSGDSQLHFPDQIDPKMAHFAKNFIDFAVFYASGEKKCPLWVDLLRKMEPPALNLLTNEFITILFLTPVDV